MSEVRSGVDKVRAGEPFHMPDWDIVALMSKAKGLAHEFNTLFPVDAPRALELLKSLFGRIGNDSVIIPVLSVEFGFNIEIGGGTLVNMNCTLMDCFRITLGDRVQVAPSVLFFTGGHAVKASERRTRDPVTGEDTGTVTTGAPITVGDEVWIGGGSIILPGVVIGPRTTIGAGSVVTKSIPADVFAAGNPCRVIRQLD